ncbi:O-antigen translocase [Flavobacterium sp.]|uniref:O-antigen translocase n=1 Tax=Flavobacterium sp. TaxID=239 RepID=UPI0037BF139D
MNLFKKILQNQLFKISSLNSFSVLIKMGIGVITSNVLAVFVGAGGMAYIGNFRNFTSALEGVSTLAFPSGIVKYVGENENQEKELTKIITTVLLTFLGLAAILSILIFSFSEVLSVKIFGNDLQYTIVFKVLAVVLPFSVLSVLYISIINGLGKYSKLIYATIISNVLALILTVFLIFQFKLVGALLSITMQSVVLFTVTFFYVPKELQILGRINIKEYDFSVIKKLAGFSFMVLPSMLISPFLMLEIRKFLIVHVGLKDAGFWEAITSISNLYLIFITTLVSVYFYPELIRAKNKWETKAVFYRFYKVIIPIFIGSGIVIYFLRFFILKILYTDEFLPVADLFIWQLINDFFKICGMILGFQFLAKKMVLPYILLELLSNIFLYFVSIYLIKIVGIQGVLMAMALEQFLYFAVLLFYFRKTLF